MSPLTFLVPGEDTTGTTRGGAVAEPTSDATGKKGRVKQTVRVGARRAGGADVRMTAVPGEDVVVLQIEGGPALTLHPEHARDLLRAQEAPATRAGAGPPDGEVAVPIQLNWNGVERPQVTRAGTRNRLGDVLLHGVEVVSDAAKEFAADFAVSAGQSLAASLLVKGVDSQVKEGVYRLYREALPPLKTTAKEVTSLDAGKPLLVFIHGTFSNTSAAFSKLWSDHPALVGRLFDHYGDDRVFAVDHATLGASPIQNAITLAEALPANARLNLVTHSRGGLVGEVLARACDPRALETPFPDDGSDYRNHRDDLATLVDLLQTKRAKVDRLVRVACPARGTLLASKRVDAYLSVLKWSMQLAGVPVLPQVVDFLNGVAQYRADPTKIPGLAAQVPGNPLVEWLHDVDGPIEGDLRVIAGDIEGDSLMSWIKTLLADSFYWTDNDLVVHTRAMYGGVPRSTKATFVLDRGGKVTHSGYFANSRTARSVVDALTGVSLNAFRPIGPRSYAGRDATGERGASAPANAVRPDRPCALLVPGIFGSHLADDAGRVWLDWDAVTPLKRLKTADTLRPDGLVEEFYGDLATFLARSYRVVACPYNWAQPLERSARAVAQQLAETLHARAPGASPVHIVAHSSGGLIVRMLELVDGDLWTRWLNTGSRLLLLGTPNRGSWAPMQVLSGDDTLGDLLGFLSPPFREFEARKTIATWTGFVQLQAGLDGPLANATEWDALAANDTQRFAKASVWHSDPLQRRVAEWGVPGKDQLEPAVALHRTLQDRRDTWSSTLSGRMAVVAGRGVRTPHGYEGGTADEELKYVYTEAGDGHVTCENASIPGVPTWVVDCGHLELAKRQSVFGAYVELLETGRTDVLQSKDATAPAGIMASRELWRDRPARTPQAIDLPVTNERLLGGTPREWRAPADATTLHVSVVNGDLSFIRQPLLLGHYRSSKLTGAEYVVDRLVDHHMKAALEKGQYPLAAGSHQVFLNTRVRDDDPRRLPRPEAVIVVGLGEEGELRPADLIRTVRHGVIAWAQRLSERASPPRLFEIAATLVGSGGIGMGAGQSAQLVVQGVLEANEKLAAGRGPLSDDSDREWPRVERLFLTELYLDRATEAWRALTLSDDPDQGYVLEEHIRSGAGALVRPLDSTYRGADYDFIRASTLGRESIAYTLDTKRARAEDQPQPVQAALLKALLADAADDRSQNPSIRRTLFRLLVPVEMESFLAGSTEVQLEVDAGTAPIPWELLETAGDESVEPWAIRARLLRKLRTRDYRAQVSNADLESHVLIVGEPVCNPDRYPPLPGARAEAKEVHRAFIDGGLSERCLTLLLSEKADAKSVIDALLDRDWRIVHIAGHGEPPELVGPKPVKADDPPQRINPRGVVLSGDVFLSPREIRSMRKIPELVFINCCHLGKFDSKQALEPRVYPEFAAGVADELIKAGVRCVIAAGWAVEDHQAKVFARTFYAQLLGGQRFIDAVAEARRAAWKDKKSGNTWAAYQCYGDPDWRLRRERRAGTDEPKPDEEFAKIASPQELVLALDTLAVRCTYQQEHSSQRTSIRALERRFGSKWGRQGRVAEAFARACAEAGDRPAALEWYGKALEGNDGGASVKAAEQYANLRIRQASAEAKKKTDAVKAKAIEDGVDEDLAAVREATAEAIAVMRHEISRLENIVALATSTERQSLLGSAYKRLALLARRRNDDSDEAVAIERMRAHYERAEDIARATNEPTFFYPALNRLAADIALNGCMSLDPLRVEAIRKNLDEQVQTQPDFWNVVSQIELQVYEALADGTLPAELPRILARYDDLSLRVSQTGLWTSVCDQADFVLHSYLKHQRVAKAAATELLNYLGTLAGRATN